MNAPRGIKVLKALAASGARLVREGNRNSWVLMSAQSKTGRVLDEQVADELLSRDCLQTVSSECMVLSETGRKLLRRLLSGSDGFLDQHRTPFGVMAGTREALRPCQVNLSESPLAWLASRKDRKGRKLLDTAQVKAGERLRSDFSFACLMPAYGNSWRVERTSGSGSPAGSATDLSDDVFAARQRIDRTLSVLEPALAALLIDVCCHLKGLETVEAERGWPARSAKVVLQIALSSLAERYGYAGMRAPDSSRTRSWHDVANHG